MNFYQKLSNIAKKNNSRLCVGLDPDLAKLPAPFKKSIAGVTDFLKKVVLATKDKVCCYKPNSAFFESMGMDGWKLLEKIVALIPSNIPVILDAKRADIGNTSAHYAKTVFEIFGADAITVNPYMGFDSVEPFIKYSDKGVFILVLTSNKGSFDFQQLKVGLSPLYMKVAEKVKEWNTAGNIGIVAGATKPTELGRIREVLKKEIFLIPGIGTQGGDLAASCKNCFKYDGSGIFNVSRDILYAPTMDDVRNKAEQYRALIQESIPRN